MKGLSDVRLFRQQCFVDGVWVDAGNGETMPVTNPASGLEIGTVPRFDVSETRLAIEAAEAA